MIDPVYIDHIIDSRDGSPHSRWVYRLLQIIVNFLTALGSCLAMRSGLSVVTVQLLTLSEELYVTKSALLLLSLPPGEGEPASTRAPVVVVAAAPNAGAAEAMKSW